MILVGVILRVIQYFIPKSLWGDEFWSVSLASKTIWQVIVGSAQDVHPPLYFILLHYTIDDPRLVSFLAGIATMIAAYFMAKHLFGKTTAKITAFLIAISPYALHSQGEIRSYALAAAFVTLAICFVTCRQVGGPPITGELPYIFAGLAIYTQHYAWAVIPALMTMLRRFTPLAVIVCGLPMLFIAGFQAIANEHALDLSRVSEYWNLTWMVKKLGGILFHFSVGYRYAMLEWTFMPLQESLFQLCLVVSSIMGGLFLIGIIRYWKKAYFRDTVLVALIAPIVLLAIFYPIRLEARYLAFAWPLFIITIAYGLEWIDWFIRILVMSIIGIAMILVSWYQIWLPYDPIHKEDWVAARKEYKKLAELGDGYYILGVTNMNEKARATIQAHADYGMAVGGAKPKTTKRFPDDGLAVIYEYSK